MESEVVRFDKDIWADNEDTDNEDKDQTSEIQSEIEYRAALITAFNAIPKCKYSHRAERLIHIELGDKYRIDYTKKCAGCGKPHREWFKVPVADCDGWDEVRRVIVHWLKYIDNAYNVGMLDDIF